LRFVDSFIYNNTGVAARVPDYTDLNLRLAWIMNDNFVFSLNGQNLLHNQHAEYVISKPNPSAEIERSVYLKVSCRL
jgi:iron complex outermembrane receptor protein